MLLMFKSLNRTGSKITSNLKLCLRKGSTRLITHKSRDLSFFIILFSNKFIIIKVLHEDVDLNSLHEDRENSFHHLQRRVMKDAKSS